MIDIKFIRDNAKLVKEGVKKKGADIDIDKVLVLDKDLRKILQKIEELRAKQNKVSEEIPQIKEKTEKEKKIAAMKKIKEELKKMEVEYDKKKENFNKLMRLIPNLPLEDVPEGTEKDNVVLAEIGKKPDFKFKPKDYIEIAESLDLIDTERAGKVSGTRFGYIKRAAVLLEFALVQYAFDILTDQNVIKKIIDEKNLKISAKPFIPVIPPVMIKPEAMAAMGYLDRGAEEIYHLEKDDLYLVGTSEQSIGPMHRDEILDVKELPLRYAGFSSCFRREAGSYGKDTKGILRVHQFDKVEMFSFCRPETSHDEHELILGIEEELMKNLELPYRIILIAAGDLGDPAAKKYDIEVWLPGQKQYRETHSTSNTTDYQARRLNIRYRDAEKVEILHTLNGTAFAIGRMIIAILENYQKEDGSIEIPRVLQKYISLKVIKK